MFHDLVEGLELVQSTGPANRENRAFTFTMQGFVQPLEDEARYMVQLTVDKDHRVVRVQRTRFSDWYDLSGSTDPLQLCTKRSSLASLPSKAFLEELVEGSPMFDKLCEHTCHLADHLRVVKKMMIESLECEFLKSSDGKLYLLSIVECTWLSRQAVVVQQERSVSSLSHTASSSGNYDRRGFQLPEEVQ